MWLDLYFQGLNAFDSYHGEINVCQASYEHITHVHVKLIWSEDFNNSILSTQCDIRMQLKTKTSRTHSFGINNTTFYHIDIKQYSIRIWIWTQKRLRIHRSCASYTFISLRMKLLLVCEVGARKHCAHEKETCRLLLNILEQREFKECTYKKVDGEKEINDERYVCTHIHTQSMARRYTFHMQWWRSSHEIAQVILKLKVCSNWRKRWRRRRRQRWYWRNNLYVEQQQQQ